VQGEGRGHMTQSIAMKRMLENAGVSVDEVLIGSSDRREVPPFYYNKIKANVTSIESPNLSADKKNRSVNVLRTLIKNSKNIPAYRKSLRMIDEKIRTYRPDLIINFYEPLAGIYYMFHKCKVPMICIGHHYLFHHPDFNMPDRKLLDKITLRLYTSLTAYGATRKLALSFYPLKDCTEKSIYVIPPLLRSEVLEKQPVNGNYLLVYLLNSGYMNDVIKWHEKNPSIILHCFVDKKEIKDVVQYHEHLYFHQLNDQKFVEMMAGARGLITTAGFESVCEAMYLKKPALIVPVEGHYEQFCNSRDAFKAGAGIYDDRFDISRFLGFLAQYKQNNERYLEWVKLSQELTLKQIRSVLDISQDNVRYLNPYHGLEKRVSANL